MSRQLWDSNKTDLLVFLPQDKEKKSGLAARDYAMIRTEHMLTSPLEVLNPICISSAQNMQHDMVVVEVYIYSI